MNKLIYLIIAFMLSTLFPDYKFEPAPELTNEEYLMKYYDTITIDGSTSMVPLHQSLNDLFSSETETEEVWHSTTVGSFKKLITGENDILFGVDYSNELFEQAKNCGVDLVKKEITREAFIFLINKNNPVRNLTTEQIKDIYSGKITNWNEVGGDNAPITAFQRNSDSGSQMKMEKFMSDSSLMKNDVTYGSNMGSVVEHVSNYDEGKYSIAYSMYTFTENQYPSDEVILLSVDGVYPDDESIFNETYPIVIYNYMYYNKNNIAAGKFAERLYEYLMSDEGQKLISDSGYVNLNAKYDRNKDIEVPLDLGINSGMYWIGFYDEYKNEYYDVKYNDDGNTELVVYKSYNEYVLHDSKYFDNQKANDFIDKIVNSDIMMNSFTASLQEEEGYIYLFPWMDSSFDQDDFFNFIYEDIYYFEFKYYIDDDIYVLEAHDEDTFKNYLEHGYLNDFLEYAENYVPGATIELTEDDLVKLYMKKDMHYYSGEDMEYLQPFK